MDIIIIIIMITTTITTTIGIWRMQRQGQLSCGRIISGSDISTRDHGMKRERMITMMMMMIVDWQLAHRKF